MTVCQRGRREDNIARWLGGVLTLPFAALLWPFSALAALRFVAIEQLLRLIVPCQHKKWLITTLTQVIENGP